MQTITQTAGQDLKWSQPHFGRREFELRQGSALAGTLAFDGMFGTMAAAESGDGAWTFKRVGFWRQQASIRAKGAATDLAIFTNNTWHNGGELVFASGSTFKATTNFWKTHFDFSTAAGEPLMRFDYGGVFHLSADVEITPLGAQVAQLPLLVLFGWYLVVMLNADDGSGAVIAAM